MDEIPRPLSNGQNPPGQNPSVVWRHWCSSLQINIDAVVDQQRPLCLGLSSKCAQLETLVKRSTDRIYRRIIYMDKPQREKTNLLTGVPNEDSDQPEHSRSLIRVFIVRTKKLCILGYPKYQTLRMHRLI